MILRQGLFLKLYTPLRWLLLLPLAFAVEWTIQGVISHFIFAMLPRLDAPCAEALLWEVIAPVVFVIVGVAMAPDYKLETGVALGGLKISTAIYGLCAIVPAALKSASWTTPDPASGLPYGWLLGAFLLRVAAIIVVIPVVAAVEKKSLVRSGLLAQVEASLDDARSWAYAGSGKGFGRWLPAERDFGADLKWCAARAAIWGHWPLFLTLPLASPAMLFYDWKMVVLVCIAVNLLWELLLPKIRIGVAPAALGTWMAGAGWVICPLAGVFLYARGEATAALAAALWPAIVSAIGAADGERKSGIQKALMEKLGYKHQNEISP